MIRPDQIPDEAVEAAAKGLCRADGFVPDRLRSDGTATWKLYGELARAAIAAALGAWPEAHVHEWQRPWLGGMSGTDIVLPLPSEDRPKDRPNCD